MKRMIKRKWWRQEWRVAWSWESYSLQSILKILPLSLVSALRLSDSLSLTCSHLLNSSSKAASFLRLDRLSHSFSVSLNRFLRLSHCIRFSRYKYLGTSTRNKIGPWWLVLFISFGPSCFLFIYKACVFFFFFLVID